jgi:uncharacterized protein YbjT (DUF2867 family)
MSGLDADTTSPLCYAVTYGHPEQMLHQSGCAVTIARTSIFAEFFLQFLRTARERGEIRLPAQDGRVSLVSISDIGRCLAELALRGPAGCIHELTGPAALDMHDIAAEAARIWHTQISYVDLTPSGLPTGTSHRRARPLVVLRLLINVHLHPPTPLGHRHRPRDQLSHRQPLALSDLLDG